MATMQPKKMTLGELDKKYSLPKLEKDVILPKTKGDVTGIEFEGAFKFKVMTLDQEAKFNGEVDSFIFTCTDGKPLAVSDGLLMYAKAKFYLKHAIISAPEWWYDFADNQLDANIITRLYILALGLKNDVDAATLQDDKDKVSA